MTVATESPRASAGASAGETTPGLVVDQVTLRRGRRVVLREVSLTARAGEILAIVGPNGAGKSTLLRAVAGAFPFEGRIEVRGRSVAGMQPRERARELTLVPQQSGLDAALSVDEVVAQGRFPHRPLMGALGPSDHEAVGRAMRWADVESLRLRPYNQLSHGEQRRVILARALATEAPVILLDEPTAALDVRHVMALFTLLRERAAAGQCIVMVLHQLQEVAMVADRVLLLADGAVQTQGSVAEVITAENIRSVYDVELIPNAGFAYQPRIAP